MTSKGKILQIIERMPEDVSIDQVIEKLYLFSKIEEGLNQADAGEVLRHEELKQQLLSQQTK